MSAHIEALFVRVRDAIYTDIDTPTGPKDIHLKAVLWDINAEAWERGVMWKGGIGTIPPPREPNPYLTGTDQ